MAGEPVKVYVREPLDRAALLDEIVALGGRREPDRDTDAELSRDERTVWIDFAPGSEPDPEAEAEETAYVEHRLGGPVGAWLVLTGTRAEGTDRLEFEVIDAIARGRTVLVDRLTTDPLDDRIVTVDHLRSRLAAGAPYLFADPIPPTDAEG